MQTSANARKKKYKTAFYTHTHTHTKLITTDVGSLACNTNLHIALQKDMLLISFYFNIAHYRIH